MIEQPHQKAVTSDGYSILEKAVIEHNIIATQKIYLNIQIPQLASILGMEPNTTEKLIAKMISEERLKGIINS